VHSALNDGAPSQPPKQRRPRRPARSPAPCRFGVGGSFPRSPRTPSLIEGIYFILSSATWRQIIPSPKGPFLPGHRSVHSGKSQKRPASAVEVNVARFAADGIQKAHSSLVRVPVPRAPLFWNIVFPPNINWGDYPRRGRPSHWPRGAHCPEVAPVQSVRDAPGPSRAE